MSIFKRFMSLFQKDDLRNTKNLKDNQNSLHSAESDLLREAPEIASTPLNIEKRERIDYNSSISYLKEIGCLGAKESPKLPKQMPRYDDEELGFSFFREGYEGSDFSNMTLNRTFFGKSEFVDCSFLNTDLSESVLCYCDYIRVDFSESNLSNSDLRASIFEDCIFENANMENVKNV